MEPVIWLVVVSVALGAGAAWWWLQRPPAMRETVIVNFVYRNDEAVRGVLWTSRGPWLVLKDAEALKAGQPPTQMDREFVIHRSQVAFLQVVNR